MKTYPSNRSLILAFLAGEPDGATSSGSLFFAGPRLYSYGTHFLLAEFKGGSLYYNPAPTTPTTTKQRRLLLSLHPEALPNV